MKFEHQESADRYGEILRCAVCWCHDQGVEPYCENILAGLAAMGIIALSGDPQPMSSWQPGDIVSRDGTDEHVIVEIEDDCLTVECIKQPSKPWTTIG